MNRAECFVPKLPDSFENGVVGFGDESAGSDTEPPADCGRLQAEGDFSIFAGCKIKMVRMPAHGSIPLSLSERRTLFSASSCQGSVRRNSFRSPLLCAGDR
jgi:hypothetical protein